MCGRLAAWFRELTEPPAEIVLLGIVGVCERVAIQAARLEVDRIVRDAGEWPSWLAYDPPARVGRGGRPISLVDESGRVMTFPTFAAAARHEGIVPIALRERITRVGNRAFIRF
jgi:hypothetical protein